MKVLLVFSLLLVCINATEDLQPYVCSEPLKGAKCQQPSTFYWSPKDSKCVNARQLIDSCGFFNSELKCNVICTTTFGLNEYLETVTIKPVKKKENIT